MLSLEFNFVFCRVYERKMSSRDIPDRHDYPLQEGEDMGHRHPGRGPVRRGGREGAEHRGGGGEGKMIKK